MTSELQEVLNNPTQYRGQIELFFDNHGEQSIPAFASNILRWSNTKRGIQYIFKKQQGQWKV